MSAKKIPTIKPVKNDDINVNFVEPDPEPQAQSAKLTPVGKVTVASVYGAISMRDIPPLFIGSAEQPEKNPEAELKICRIAGFASGIKMGVSSYGTWSALLGEFAATNYATGEMFTGKTCLIPGPMGDALVETMNDVMDVDVNGKVRFSVDISVTRSPREPDKKYVYVVRPVLDAKITTPALILLGLSE